jgi:hypothetical protein
MLNLTTRAFARSYDVRIQKTIALVVVVVRRQQNRQNVASAGTWDNGVQKGK